MTPDGTGRWLGAFVALSCAAHAAAFGVLGGRSPTPPARARTPALVTMEVMEKPPPTSASLPPSPSSPPPPRVRAAPAAVRRARAEAPVPPAPAPPPQAPEPPPFADFTGVTLTNEGAGAGPGWSSAVGDGRSSTGPLGPVVRPPAHPSGEPAPVVAARDLRRAPEPPSLDEALARNYPAEERRERITGSAVIRARILPDGRVQPLGVVSASRPAFADACRRTVAASRWSQPLDRAARPCATDISYTCRFELDP